MVDIVVEVNLKGLERVLDRIEDGLQDALDETLRVMEGVAKMKAPIDTGFLRASIFAVTVRRDGSSAAFAEALAQAPRRRFASDIPVPHGRFEGFLVAGAEYAPFVNYGAHHVRGNSVRLGSRQGRIGVELSPGVFATFMPGYLFMEEAAEVGKKVLKSLSREAIRKAVAA